MIKSDVDIDFFNRDDLLKLIPHVVACRVERGSIKKHNTGVYLQDIPVNPMTGFASIDYETAQEQGYFKLDFLNVSVYKDIKNEQHLIDLLSVDPIWELLYEKDICDQLFHINGYHTLLAELKPNTIEELAMVLALIRPGKKYLIEKCKTDGFSSILNEIWTKDNDQYYFKKSHGIAYAHVIVMQLNKLCESVST